MKNSILVALLGFGCCARAVEEAFLLQTVVEAEQLCEQETPELGVLQGNEVVFLAPFAGLANDDHVVPQAKGKKQVVATVWLVQEH